MKKNLLYLLLLPLAFMISCSSDDEPEVNLLVGQWELDGIVVSDPPSGYSLQSINLEPGATILNESSYIIEFNDDFTYERDIEDGTLFDSNGNAIVSDLKDEGQWEEDGDQLDLDIDEADLDDLPTRFTVMEKSEESLVLETNDLWFAWSPTLVNAGGLDTLSTTSGFDSLVAAGYLEIVEMTFTMTFDRD